MHAAMERAVERARKDKHPTLLEVRTYRFMGHSMSDPIHGHYRTSEEVEDQRKRDPIARLVAAAASSDGLHRRGRGQGDGQGGHGRGARTRTSSPTRRPEPRAGGAVRGRATGRDDEPRAGARRR